MDKHDSHAKGTNGPAYERLMAQERDQQVRTPEKDDPQYQEKN